MSDKWRWGARDEDKKYVAGGGGGVCDFSVGNVQSLWEKKEKKREPKGTHVVSLRLRDSEWDCTGPQGEERGSLGGWGGVQIPQWLWVVEWSSPPASYITSLKKSAEANPTKPFCAWICLSLCLIGSKGREKGVIVHTWFCCCQTVIRLGWSMQQSSFQFSLFTVEPFVLLLLCSHSLPHSLL